MSSDPAIRVEAVTFAYGSDAVLRDVSCTIGRGEFVGIIGPNGSGKSTLLKLMSGYLRPARGQVAIDGRPVERLSRAALGRLIGVVPQDTLVALPFTVGGDPEARDLFSLFDDTLVRLLQAAP